jgi:hypothetical protein
VREDVEILPIWCFNFVVVNYAGLQKFKLWGNIQGNWKPGRICIFREYGAETPGSVGLLVAAVELWTLKAASMSKALLLQRFARQILSGLCVPTYT